MILKKQPGVLAVVVALVAASTIGWSAGWSAESSDGWSVAAAAQAGDARQACDPAFAILFTPRRPVLGRYEACTDPRPLADIARADWVIEAPEPADAFGGAGAYDHPALSLLYGGRHPSVARSWTDTADRFEAVTLISPYPNATLTTLEPGTLIIRWICEHTGNASC